MLGGNNIAGKGWGKKIIVDDVFTSFWSKMVESSEKEVPFWRLMTLLVV